MGNAEKESGWRKHMGKWAHFGQVRQGNTISYYVNGKLDKVVQLGKRN